MTRIPGILSKLCDARRLKGWFDVIAWPQSDDVREADIEPPASWELGRKARAA